MLDSESQARESFSATRGTTVCERAMPQLGVVVEGQGAGLEEADQLRVVGDPDGDEAVGVQQALHRKLSEVFERHRWVVLSAALPGPTRAILRSLSHAR